MRWAITAAALVAVAAWAIAITVGIAEHSERSTELVTIYLVNAAVLSTVVALGLWLTDLILGQLRQTRDELQEARKLGERIFGELRSEHVEAGRAVRALFNDDDSNPRIRKIRT